MKIFKQSEFKVAFSFLIVSLLWILLSDRFFLRSSANHTSAELTFIQSIKGLAYITLVSVLLFVMVRKGQNRLRKSQEEYKDLFELNSQPMLIFTNDSSKLSTMNNAAADKLGYPQNELEKIKLADFRKVRDEDSDNSKNNGKSTFFYTTKNGDELIWEETAASVVLNKKEATLVTINDITALEKVKSEMAKREALLNLILNSITDGFLIIDNDLKVLRANSVFKSYFKDPPAVWENTSITDLYHAFEGSISQQQLKYAIENKISVHFEIQNSKGNRWFRIAAYPFDQGLSVIFRDITKEKEEQIKSMRQEQNMLALINNTEDLIWSIDKDFKYFAYNHAYEQHFREYFKEDIYIGKGALTEAQGTAHVEEWSKLYQRALSGESFTVEREFYHIEFKRQFTSVRFSPIYNAEGNIIGVGCFLQNITNRKLYEERIEEQNRRLKEIAFFTSHTLRSPLANIMGLVNILDKDNPFSELNQQVIENLKVSANELDTVVRNIINRTVYIENEH